MRSSLASEFRFSLSLGDRTLVSVTPVKAIVGLLVDLVRISVYLTLFATAGAGLAGSGAWPLVAAGALSAFTGVLIGRHFLHKITMRSVQILVGAFLLGVGGALLLGLV